MKEKCSNCKYQLKLRKADYSEGGCVDTDMEGFVCLAFSDEGLALWMVGVKEGLCECYASKEEHYGKSKHGLV